MLVFLGGPFYTRHIGRIADERVCFDQAVCPTPFAEYHFPRHLMDFDKLVPMECAMESRETEFVWRSV